MDPGPLPCPRLNRVRPVRLAHTGARKADGVGLFFCLGHHSTLKIRFHHGARLSAFSGICGGLVRLAAWALRR